MISIESCQKVLDNKRPEFTIIEVLTDEDRSYKTKVRAICQKGHSTERLISTLIRTGCNECQQDTRLIERCSKALKNRGTGLKLIEIVKPHVKTYMTCVKVICENGHTVEKSIDSIIEYGCNVCSGNLPRKVYTEEELYYKLKDVGLRPTSKLENKLTSPARLSCRTCWYQFSVQSLNSVLRGNGCPKCSGKVQKEPWEIVIECSRNGWTLNWFEYDPDKYLLSKMAGRCIKCGNKRSKIQLRSYVNNSATCPSCNPPMKGFDANKKGILYYLRVQDDYKVYYKIGITNLSVKERFCNSDLEKITVLSELHYEEGWKASRLEKYFLDTFSEYRYQGEPILKSGGNTELFVKDVLELDNP